VRRLLPLLAAVALLGTERALAAAQEAQAAGPTVRLTAPQTPPGEETFVTVMLQKAPTNLQALEIEIQFDPKQLTYVTSRKAISADLARAEMTVNVEGAGERAGTPGAPPKAEDGPAGPARIVLTIKGTRPIPDGPVAEMRFQVAEGLEGVRVKLGHRVTAKASDGTAIADLAAVPGEIHVSSAEKPKAPLVFACFFYMH
jgi:hypothetical protein